MRVEEVTGDAAAQAEPMEVDEPQEEEQTSLIIPITTSTKSKDLFVEIFSDEISDIKAETLLQVLRDEDANLEVYTDAALMYMNQKLPRDSSHILQAACDVPGGNREQKSRILASAGIALLMQSADKERSLADHRFTSAGKVCISIVVH